MKRRFDAEPIGYDQEYLRKRSLAKWRAEQARRRKRRGLAGMAFLGDFELRDGVWCLSERVMQVVQAREEQAQPRRWSPIVLQSVPYAALWGLVIGAWVTEDQRFSVAAFVFWLGWWIVDAIPARRRIRRGRRA